MPVSLKEEINNLRISISDITNITFIKLQENSTNKIILNIICGDFNIDLKNCNICKNAEIFKKNFMS